MAWQMTSSEPQPEQTGVERENGRVPSGTGVAVSNIRSKGLVSAVRRILAPYVWYPTDSATEGNSTVQMVVARSFAHRRNSGQKNGTRFDPGSPVATIGVDKQRRPP